MYQRILVPFDGSPTSSAGLDEAVRLAKLSGAAIRLVHVLDHLPFSAGEAGLTGDLLGILLETGSQVLREGKRRVAAADVPVDTFLCESFGARVYDVVYEQVETWNADLIVIGTHGRRGFRRLLLGSDAEQIARAAPVPVLLVRMPQAQTTAHVDSDSAARSAVLTG
jgi:nucleotide-binding universal stress UspA family protein